jgi:hypothetical protein
VIAHQRARSSDTAVSWREVTMTKKNWQVTTPGYKPFPMILLECALDHDGALAFARSTWPNCTVE